MPPRGDNMRWHASIGIALLALSHLVCANVSSALAQAGSTGGTIGKQDKSISGGGDATESQHAVPTRKHPRAASHSVATAPAGGPCSRIIGTWLWSNGVSVTVNSNNKTTQSDGSTASVVCAEGVYTFTWLGFAKAQMTLSPDGKRLSGTSPIGVQSAVRR
jgi:hypothetical protein